MSKKRTARDYKFIRLIGEGSFSSVYLAVDANVVTVAGSTNSTAQVSENAVELAERSSGDQDNSGARTKPRKYAIKVCQKSHIKRQGKQLAIMREKEIMNILNQESNEHFIRLYCTFQDVERLFFVMSYAEKGELLTYMLKNSMSLALVRRFTFQLVEALEHLHSLDIVHRDLKPENILLSDNLNVLISDFGSAQIYRSPSTGPRRNSFVGTAQYVSPEMLKDRQASNMSDLWALGIIVFQMLTNALPFEAPNEYLIYKRIQSLEYTFPPHFDQFARDLVSSLIKLDPMERLGAQDDVKLEGYKSIRRHDFLTVQDDDSPTENQSDNSTQHPTQDPDLVTIDKITPGLDETQLLRLLTDS